MNPPASQEFTPSPRNRLQAGIRILIPLVILAVAWTAYQVLAKEPEEAKRPPEPPRIIKTTVEELKRQDYTTIIRTQGVVRPHNEVAFNAEVSGRIVEISPAFEDGAFFREGDMLLKVDDADYKTALVTAQAQLARATATFAQEEARAKQARLNWEDLGYDEAPNDLVLRLPQLNEAKANVESAEAQVDQANRDLERTIVRAPFDGRVKIRNVGLGQSIGSGMELATVFAIDYAEVRLPIAPKELPFLNLPEHQTDPAVPVEIRDALSDEIAHVWKGEIVRTEGTLEENSLELFAIARITDPFGLVSKEPPLRIGQPVLGFITGRTLEQVYVVPRKAVRQVDRIYLVDKQELKLDRHIIDPVWTDQDHLVVQAPQISNGSLLATSQLTYAPDEARVEILPNTSDQEMSAKAEDATDKASEKKSDTSA